MCGVAGIIYNNPSCVDIDCKKSISDMIDVMRHRGPNDIGMCYIDTEKPFELGSAIPRFRLEMEGGDKFALSPESTKPIGALGFTRLSIRDLSYSGHQPMVDDTNQVGIIYNGEIYNTDELKQQYLSGNEFRGESDTEVLLNLYLEKGIDFTVKSLDGMFAFAIVDMRTQMLYLARDRVGIKPLYIYKDNHKLIFGSEIKALLASNLVEAKPSISAFYEMLMFGYNYSRTLIEGVNELLAGTYCCFKLSDLTQVEENQYWKPEDEVVCKSMGTYRYNKSKLKSLLSKAVTSHLVSDVSVGCQLSGGIDSSLITYFFCRNKNKAKDKERLRNIAFGIIPDNIYHSEQSYMDAVSQLTGIDNQKIFVSDESAYKKWRDVVWYMDGIPTFINEVGIYTLAHAAKNSDTTVLLSGEGADEIFSGYDYISRFDYVIWLARLFSWIKHDNDQVKKGYYIYDSNQSGMLDEENYILYSADGNYNDVIKDLCPKFNKFKEEACRIRIEKIKTYSKKKISRFDKIRCYNISTRLGALCNRQDKMTMAYSIENRVPYLSNDIISFGLKLPKRHLVKKLNGIAQGKYILKDICSDIFGHSFSYRKKEGFYMPIMKYLKYFVESTEYNSSILKLERRNLVDIDKVKKLCSKISEMTDSSYIPETIFLWRLFSYEFFCEQYIDD